MLEETKITESLIKEYAKYSDRPENKGLIEACGESVIVFSKHMLGIELYAWQKIVAMDIMAAMNDQKLNREFVVVTSRQIGKTTLAAILALWISVFNKLPTDTSNNSDCGIISATDRQAKLVLKEVTNYIRMGDQYCREKYSMEKGDAMDKGILSMLIDEKEDNNKEMMTFCHDDSAVDPKSGAILHKYGSFFLKDSKVGTKLKSYPPTTSILGQKFAYLHEDECGLAERFDEEAHFEYIKPTGVARNAIRIYTSTPWQPSGFFYELVDPDDTNSKHLYKRYLFTIDAIELENPFQHENAMKDINKMREDGKNGEVERAFYCRFVKGETSYFDPDKVDSLFDVNVRSVVDGSLLDCDIGVDFGGQVKSRTVITISHLDSANSIHRLFHRTYEVGEDDSLLEDLEELMLKFPNWQRVIPDDCPAGDFRIRQMMEKGWNVEPMSFRTWKVKKYGSFRNKLNGGDVNSYPDDELKVEMKALEWSNTSTQSKINAPRGYRDDLIDSFVMSCYFFLEEDIVYESFGMRDLHQLGYKRWAR